MNRKKKIFRKTFVYPENPVNPVEKYKEEEL